MVGYDIRADRVVVTRYNVAEYGLHNANTFRVEMYYDGRIRIAWTDIAVDAAVVGLSDGLGLHEGYVETDFSKTING